MLERLKGFLKFFLPPPVRAFNREIERILAAILDGRKEISRACKQLEDGVSTRLDALSAEQSSLVREENRMIMQQLIDLSSKNTTLLEKINAQAEEINQLQRKLSQVQMSIVDGNSELLQQTNSISAVLTAETAQHQQEKLRNAVEAVHKQAAEGRRSASEAVWAEIFNNAISGSPWLTNTAFAPGRWAVGYPALYAMYRILNEVRPKRILELGLGQSTRMIAQYAATHESVEHIVVEHDPEWISFFKNDFQLSARSKIVQLDREMVSYKEAESVRVFKGFRESFDGQKFDFLSIDAPLGGDMKQYARIDILSLLPDCLSDDFVIMIDDAERSGEAHTIAEMEMCLKQEGIPYRRGRYSGQKDSVILCAERVAFLATL